MSWAIDEKGYTQRRACRLVGMDPKTYRHVSTRPDEAGLWRDNQAENGASIKMRRGDRI